MRTWHRISPEGPAPEGSAPAGPVLASPGSAGAAPRGRAARAWGLAAAAGLAAGTLGIAGAPAASASIPADAIVAVGPHQTFVGDVNGASAASAPPVIQVGCFGPVTPTSTGHPLAGQTVAVHLVADDPTKTAGYTGEAATRIVVQFQDSGPVVGLPVSLDAYDVKAAIPTSLELPCYGPGKVNFVPSPTSSTARTATVAVTYQSIGV